MNYLYNDRYILGLYESDDDTLIGVFDNVQELALFMGKTPDAMSSTVAHILKDKSAGVLVYNHRSCILHKIYLFEEDIMKTFGEMRDNWLMYLGDMDTVLHIGKRKIGKGNSYNGYPNKKLNSPFFDKYKDYYIEDIKWGEVLHIWLRKTY